MAEVNKGVQDPEDRLRIGVVFYGLFMALLVVSSIIGTASAALKPAETVIHPVDNKGVMVFKTTPQGDLRINLYFPPNWKASDRRPIIIFFFGGSCATGSPMQFASTAEYFAARGLVAAAPEYRIESVHHTPPERCVEDGKSTIRWLRTNARHLGIDPRQVIAGGGSSGASIAAFTAYNATLAPDDEDRSISPEPNALVLLDPAFGCPPGESSPVAPALLWPDGRSPRADHRHPVLRYRRSAPRWRPRLRATNGGRRDPRGVLHRYGPTARLLQSLPGLAMARSGAPAD